jgi:hypothetical protein
MSNKEITVAFKDEDGKEYVEHFKGSHEDLKEFTLEVESRGYKITFSGSTYDYNISEALKAQNNDGTDGYDQSSQVTNEEKETEILDSDPTVQALSSKIDDTLVVVDLLDNLLSDMFGSSLKDLEVENNSVANFLSIVERFKNGEKIDATDPDMQSFFNQFSRMLEYSTTYLTLMGEVGALTLQIKIHNGNLDSLIPNYSNKFASIAKGLDPLHELQTEIETILESDFNTMDSPPSELAAESKSYEYGNPFENEILDQKRIFEIFEKLFSDQRKRQEDEERIAAEEEALRDDPPLDQDDDIVEDEGDGSSADGVEEANIVEDTEENAAQTIVDEDITSSVTGEEAIGEEPELDFGVPEQPPKLNPQDYLDALKQTNPTLSSGDSFDSIIDDIMEGLSHDQTVDRFLIPFSNLPEFKLMPTPSLITLDLPEPVINFEDSKFIYNYYTPDEEDASLRPNARQTSDFDDAQDVENNLISKFALPPRYNIVKFNSTNIGNQFLDSGNEAGNSRPYTILTQFLEENNIIQDIKNGSQIGEARILTEGGLSSAKYSSSELINTDLQSNALNNIFNILNMEANLNINPIINNSESFEKVSVNNLINNYKSRKNISSEQGNLIDSFLNGLSRSDDLPTDRVESKNKTTADFLRYISFTMTFDNASFDDVIMSADLEFGGLFENELDEYKAFSKNFYNTAKERFSTVIDAESYEESIPQGAILAFAAYEDDQLDENSGLLKPSIEHAGYVVEKIKITKAGGTESVEPIFLSKEASSFVDLDVLYGHDYVYKVRTLAILEYDFMIPNFIDASAAQFARGAFLIASRSNPIRIRCKEDIPPNHPDAIRFKYDYERDYLDLDWIYPHNPQEDISGFEIFRRNTRNDPFELIGLYNFSYKQRKLNHKGVQSVDLRKIFNFDGPNTSFTDIHFNKKNSFIYAVSSIDAHGIVSGYSPQYEVSYDSYTNNLIVNCISKGGAPKPYPNYFLKSKFEKTFNEVAKTSLKNRLTVCFNPKYYDLKIGTEQEDGTTEKLGLISKSKENDKNYIINVNNTDLGLGSSINISIDDRSVQHESFDQGILQKENLSFTFKNDE